MFTDGPQLGPWCWEGLHSDSGTAAPDSGINSSQAQTTCSYLNIKIKSYNKYKDDHFSLAYNVMVLSNVLSPSGIQTSDIQRWPVWS